MRDGFFRVAAATPQVKVADVEVNAGRIVELIREAADKGCGAVCLPELAVTAYTCGDLFGSRALIRAAEESLGRILEETEELDILCVLGIPVAVEGALYNGAAVFHRGRLLGLPVKSFIPNYSEFYEARYFAPAPKPRETVFCGQRVWLGGKLLFECENVPELIAGVEICEDLWGPEPPSAGLCKNGATLIFNSSCSDEVAGKAGYRRDLVRMWSGHIIGAYVYSDAGQGESTGDMVFAGHDIIAENGAVLSESRLFDTGLTIAEVDLEKILQERRRNNTWVSEREPEYVRIPFGYKQETLERYSPERTFSRQPFVPSDPATRSERCQLILTMQAQGLATRLRHTGCRNALIAFSGGLDSTLAALVTVRAFDILGLTRKGILTISMPCFGTTERTKRNAEVMARELGVDFKEIPIGKTVLSHFEDIGQDPENYDAAFENAQARERTQVLMDMANQRNGLMIGTGDLSELALGWSTYNGDHMSMYGVNADVPKTLVRHLVRFEAQRLGGKLGEALFDVLDTPVSPELLPPKDGEISQKTEELVGPYELHDFFLYQLLRHGFGPGKIYRMACRSFAGEYGPEVIKGWLKVFCRRFFSQQFKRSCLPDGPKVGTVSVSPRGDWRMPSDASSAVWLKEIEGL
ncbi:NAD(+) synthase [Acutalibacter sp. 1XD8-36]|uniref:NAD(+) synthase n=1 Tax=Acutalibacter sp. 1XD8-36 TaxID=2320852 RepID=UPI002638691C|nr:NAD(+) synthase [Acutalibacter sp. 1XD8-36]